jgi:hypothetical protein
MVVDVGITRRDRRVHRGRLLDYVRWMRYVRDWGLLDHAVVDCNNYACPKRGCFM